MKREMYDIEQIQVAANNLISVLFPLETTTGATVWINLESIDAILLNNIAHNVNGNTQKEVTFYVSGLQFKAYLSQFQGKQDWFAEHFHQYIP